jgi:integrase/recombinase XerD
MLTPYRRHKPNCPHFAEGRAYHHCKCKIWADGVLGGRELRKSLKTRDWTKANQMIQKWEAEEKVTERAAAVTLDEAWTSINAEFVARGLSQETIRKYKRLENQMKAFATKRSLTLLNQFDLNTLSQFRTTWADRPRAAGKKLERLRAFFRFAVDRQWVETNLATKIKMPEVADAPTMPLEPEEVKKLYAACDALAGEASKRSRLKALRLKTLMIVMRYTGLRMSDAVQLAKHQVQGNAIKVSQAKTGVVVRVPVPDFVLIELAKTPMMTASRYFWSGNGDVETVAKDYQEMVKEAFDAAGITKGASNAMSHRLRDTFAVELLLAGVPIERVSMLLGHKSVAITEKHYAPWNKAQQLQAEADVVRSWQNDSVLNPKKTGTEKVQISQALPN